LGKPMVGGTCRIGPRTSGQPAICFFRGQAAKRNLADFAPRALGVPKPRGHFVADEAGASAIVKCRARRRSSNCCPICEEPNGGSLRLGSISHRISGCGAANPTLCDPRPCVIFTLGRVGRTRPTENSSREPTEPLHRGLLSRGFAPISPRRGVFEDCRGSEKPAHWGTGFVFVLEPGQFLPTRGRRGLQV